VTEQPEIVADGGDAAPLATTDLDVVTAETADLAVPPAAGTDRAPLDPGDASLLALVDRLGLLLDRSDLSELAVEAGGTRLVLRKAVAIAAAAPSTVPAGAAVPAGDPGSATATSAASPDGGPAAAPSRPSVNAPLTGVWYGSPAPGSAPFVVAGREVAVGQVIGLIEAMKLFNEIKSDLAGRVVRVVPENGALVKAKQPLIEVEPL
jgi:acetyl-CoA carboxylase biotin carboxyl carrier protein